jgi:hypothetical protein
LEKIKAEEVESLPDLNYLTALLLGHFLINRLAINLG